MDTSLKLADHLSNLKELYLEGCVRTAPTPPPRAGDSLTVADLAFQLAYFPVQESTEDERT